MKQETILTDKTIHLAPSPITDRPDGEEWRPAVRRVRRYLEAMDLPARERLDLAVEALRLARCRAAEDPDRVETAMSALREVLDEREEWLGENDWFQSGLVREETYPAMPTLNRGNMLAADMGRVSWLQALAASLVPARKTAIKFKAQLQYLGLL